MRFRVRHETLYRYSEPVFLEPHWLRLRPRADGTQRLLSFELEISPEPQGRSECLDPEGNAACLAWFAGETRELRVAAQFEAETLRTNAFDFLMLHESQRLPVRYPEAAHASLGPYLGKGVSPAAVRRLAEEVARAASGRTVEFLSTLSQRLHSEVRHVTRDEGPPLSAAHVLASGEGACRDVAVVFMQVCRAAGLAARFVSGYELAASGDERSYMHAWAEVFLPGGGWRGFDPSRGLAVTGQHIPVAASANAEQATPIQGAFRGSALATMEFSIRMEAVP